MDLLKYPCKSYKIQQQEQAFYAVNLDIVKYIDQTLKAQISKKHKKKLVHVKLSKFKKQKRKINPSSRSYFKHTDPKVITPALEMNNTVKIVLKTLHNSKVSNKLFQSVPGIFFK